MIAKDVMKANVITVSPSTPVSEAALLMRNEDIGALVVVDTAGRPVGIVTDRDIVISIVADGDNPADFVVEDIMSKNLHLVQEDESIFGILKILGKHSIRRVPVLRKGKLVGIVSVDDLIVVITTELSNLASALSSTSKVL
ncbi:MAG TPA: CBS domain-containing protein [Thermodesulfobacteriota bacterium]|nr:CBS domain-containing protein [Thermodesulfobacteriota bacterium]